MGIIERTNNKKMLVCFSVTLVMVVSLFISAQIAVSQERTTEKTPTESVTDGAVLTEEECGCGGSVIETVNVEETPSDDSSEFRCGFVEPENWWIGAEFDPCLPTRDLPVSYDWRAISGCPPIRNQGQCGSCWAFATVGPLECSIMIKDHAEIDLSEQWLVSCNREGWGCGGGWWAHDYHEWKTDYCGGTGAVLEEYFPYTATNAPCSCPYPHEYFIDDWAYIGNPGGIPSVSSMKQAMMTYGPIGVGIRVNSAFQSYNGGLFNTHSSGDINHAVTLVGWDDQYYWGGNYYGVWILRNSWGTNWGDDGYMYITYGCCSVGYGATYVDYPGLPWPISSDQSTVILTSENMPGLTTCPAGDGPIYQHIKVSVKDEYGAPSPGIPADRFRFTVADAGAQWYGTLSCYFTAVESQTNANGEIRFKIQGGTSIVGNVTLQAKVAGVPIDDIVVLSCKSVEVYMVDGSVSLSDLVTFAPYYGGTAYRCDFTWDGTVGLGDFSIFAHHYGHYS